MVRAVADNLESMTQSLKDAGELDCTVRIRSFGMLGFSEAGHSWN
jgi:hypothetical protein